MIKTLYNPSNSFVEQKVEPLAGQGSPYVVRPNLTNWISSRWAGCEFALRGRKPLRKLYVLIVFWTLNSWHVCWRRNKFKRKYTSRMSVFHLGRCGTGHSPDYYTYPASSHSPSEWHARKHVYLKAYTTTGCVRTFSSRSYSDVAIYHANRQA